MGKVDVHEPPFSLYCILEPVGQGVPVGADIVPPLTRQLELHVELTIVTFAGAAVSPGQVPHKPPAQVPVAQLDPDEQGEPEPVKAENCEVKSVIPQGALKVTL